jgi:hypothetical protein
MEIISWAARNFTALATRTGDPWLSGVVMAVTYCGYYELDKVNR